MMRLLAFFLCLLTLPAHAETADLTIGQDHFAAGAATRFDGPAVDDLFMVGNRVTVAAPVTGAAHLAGRQVTVDAAVTGNLYAAGFGVTTTAPVGGNASVTGYTLRLGDVTGNLRAAGSEVEVGAVGGYALISGSDVVFHGTIAGDVVVAAEAVRFDDGATVAGSLKIYAKDPATIIVPDTVAAASRVTILQLENNAAGKWATEMPVAVPLWQVVGGFLAAVLVSGLIAAMVIAVAPLHVQAWRTLALAHPGRAIWSGFLVTSALAGSGFVLMLTIVGVLLLPVMLIGTGAAILAGYALGSYVLGIGLWQLTRRALPDRLVGKFGLACLGALVAGLAWLVPIAGWFFVLGLTLMGIGTLAAFLFPGGFLMRERPTPTV